MLAQARGDYDEAARQYQRALDMSGSATSLAWPRLHELGRLAQLRGDHEAARQYQRALDIDERLGDQARGDTTRPPASTSAPGIKELGNPATATTGQPCYRG